MGYRRRTAFFAGLTVAQISEFSLIVAALGLSLGHITPDIMGLITLVGVVTIFASTYMILYSGPLYRLLATPLKIFERSNPYREKAAESLSNVDAPVDVILVGLGDYGSGLAKQLRERKRLVVGVDFDPQALAYWRSKGLTALYGDMADPEIHDQLPLGRARWVVSSIRSPELNLALLNLLRQRGYEGKLALAAANQSEAKAYEKAGAHVVLRPFSDAAEQAADALTQAMDVLPAGVDWPIAFQEIRIRSGSAFAGKALREIPLRASTGVSILAVSRAGKVFYHTGPDFQLYPGDRVMIMGAPADLKKAENLLSQMQEHGPESDLAPFAVAEAPVAANSPWVGKTLSDVQFRTRYDVTVVGIHRGEERISAPRPDERLLGGDRLIVIGLSDRIQEIKILAHAVA
jgi:Trk K+ transport system NAD-binding subunit